MDIRQWRQKRIDNSAELFKRSEKRKRMERKRVIFEKERKGESLNQSEHNLQEKVSWNLIGLELEGRRVFE